MTEARLSRITKLYAAQSLRRQLLICAGVGALAALGQAPYDLPLLTFGGLIVAIWLFGQAQTLRRAASTGQAFGTGYFALTLAWIVEPFLVDAARHGWMAPFALVLMAAGLALFWAAAFALAFRLGRSRVALVLLWALAELARAYVLTGFPWSMPAYALVGGMAGQGAAWIGPHGLNLALFGLAALASLWRRPLVAAPAAVLTAVAILWPVPDAAPLAEDRPLVRLVQPNAPQHQKWEPDLIPTFFARKIDYTRAPAGAAGRPDLIVWPETSIPYLLRYAAPATEAVAEAAAGVPVVVGVQRFDGPRLHNSMTLIGPDGSHGALYDKHHLVPFGEYMPLATTAAKMGVFGLATDGLNGYSAGPGAQLLDLGALGRALPLICYEAVFPQDVAAAPERPDLLLQITNDAWFGQHSGPYQHLAQARMRAIEQGLPMVRAANTGVSAMIDTRGRMLAQIPLGRAGYVDAALPAPGVPTLYARSGDGPLALLLIALICMLIVADRHYRH